MGLPQRWGRLWVAVGGGERSGGRTGVEGESSLLMSEAQ